ncbi:DUF1853 family protein [Ferrimonas balearica]|uniref:DUF1853 family protein n=1 Tax=Ferrimonas balearica TaxID=44012 RepID=UPI001C9954B0|nr:DUF1853 family protein [Ferrimonas balearica]MBY5991549.1 DUF1853 family protein [Ferrimonas balearica]
MPLSHPVIRDLTWLLSSPPMVTGGPYINADFLHTFAQPVLAQLPTLETRQGSPLLKIRRGGRLGHYYEQLWCLAFDLHPDYQLLAHNLVVSQQKRVIGSADFVLHNAVTERLEHWEVAVKFYLGLPPSDALGQWIGPGKQDCLEEKLARLESHQLPLLRTQPGRALCHARGWEIGQQRIVLQGRLYLEPHSGALPPRIDRRVPLGYWYRHSALPQRHWRRLARTDWLAGRDWRLLPRYRPPTELDWPKHLYDVEREAWAFVVPDNW